MTVTQFVWFYITAPDNGEELRLSMASVRKHFTGEPKFLVVGEKPAWFDGPHFALRQFKGINDSLSRMPYRDTQHRIMQCATSDLVDEQFVWMMDDVVFLKPTTLKEIQIPRHDPWHRENVTTAWNQLIKITFAALRKAGKPTLQYGTHAPHVFKKSNLRQMFDDFEFPATLLLFEILYGNLYYKSDKAVPFAGTLDGIEYPNYLKRVVKPMTRQQLDAMDVNVLNWKQKCWTPTLKLWVQQKLEMD